MSDQNREASEKSLDEVSGGRPTNPVPPPRGTPPTHQPGAGATGAEPPIIVNRAEPD